MRLIEPESPMDTTAIVEYPRRQGRHVQSLMVQEVELAR